MNIKVSIIVPVYNSEKYLKRCLDSLVNQSLNDIEIILINDFSTDNSLNILNSYKQAYPNKIILESLTENKGPGGARNLGIKKAKGQYIGFVDSDDDVSFDMFEKLYKIAVRADYDLVDCNFYEESLNKNCKTTPKEALGDLNAEKRKLMIINSGYIWSKIVKRDIIINHNIRFRENVAFEDLEFTSLIILYCKKICATNMVLYNYRCNDISITRKYNIKVHIYEKIDSSKALIEKFKELNAFDNYRDELTYRIYHVYSNMVQLAMSLDEARLLGVQVFKDLHDFFLEIVDYDYSNNKYILEMNEKDKFFAELNNSNYQKLFSEYLT
ncbi:MULTISPECIES: glycosyltransferase [unclassified Clostridium]|uniref:glycosyltransferase n=1 Tax=unclassified Clostridium TaxID=2614128 RepID=UPI000297C605|nr:MULTISPECIES: glycosyltransferase [unclassified Clostridium]EKQ51163.1 MAG: glycosyl transferase [Clostridium sp. Maddingley MBC34-26]